MDGRELNELNTGWLACLEGVADVKIIAAVVGGRSGYRNGQLGSKRGASI